MSVQRTPGDWVIANDGRFVYALNDRGFNAFWAHVTGIDTDDAELRANACLIAAAPELLDALKDAESELACQQRINSYVIDKVRAAIAKAAGENA